MPWQEESTMELRRQFIQDVHSGASPLTELCQASGISRKTGYKWLARYEAGGLAALTDQSRQPRSSPTATAPELVAALLEGRRHHPTWGPRKLARRRAAAGPSRAAAGAHGPAQRDLDRRLQGPVRFGNGEYCYPLTIADGCSRYLLSCHGLTSTAGLGSRGVFERAFQTYGLPVRIRSDNGVPFATQAGDHAPALCLAFPPSSGASNQWRHEFNTLRPHDALDDATPASVYVPSPRRYPARLPALEYPGHYEVRRVSNNGGIRWHCTWVNVSQTLGGEWIGLVELDDGEWDVYFGPLRLGRFHERTMGIEDAHGRQHRRPY